MNYFNCWLCYEQRIAVNINFGLQFYIAIELICNALFIKNLTLPVDDVYAKLGPSS